MQDEEEQKEQFDFTAERESLGCISLDQARRPITINRQSLARSASQEDRNSKSMLFMGRAQNGE